MTLTKKTIECAHLCARLEISGQTKTMARECGGFRVKRCIIGTNLGGTSTGSTTSGCSNRSETSRHASLNSTTTINGKPGL